MMIGFPLLRILLIALFLSAPLLQGVAEIRLPASGVLAGPLDDARSLMGDDIYNYPFGSGSGRVNVHGWIAVEFSPPVGRTSRFRMRWHAVGDVPLFAFPSGHFLHVTGEQNMHSRFQVSHGDLNLDTGEVTNLEVHAIFQNALIQRSSRYSRLPLISDANSFTALFVDFPPLDLPFELPFSERPATSLTARFHVDSSSQRITGFEFHGVTFLPISVLPALGLMPPFAFGRAGATIIPGLEGCLPGTTPPNQCLSEDRLPDGLISPDNAFLNPNLSLVTTELREVAERVNPPPLPGGAVIGAGAASLGGRLYVTGGSDGLRSTGSASAFDPARNEWTGLPEMPRARWRHCAVAAGGKVYVAGGIESGAAPVNAASAYDPAIGAWSAIASLPVASADAACAALDSRIFWFGGATATAPASNNAWVFDTGSGQWQPLAPLPAALAGSAIAVAGREIWIVNGTPDGQTATNRVFVFSPDSGAWREGPPTPRAVYGASAAWLDGRLYVAGGRTAPGGPLDVGKVIYHSQPTQLLAGGTWYDGLHPPLPAGGMAGAVVGDTWYLAGGDTASDAAPAPTSVVQVFAATAGWRASDSYPVFAAQTVRNAAGLGVGPAELAPGTLASIIGTNLSPRRLKAPAVRQEGIYLTTDLPEELDGIRVTVDGLPAGILAVAPERIDFQVPFGLATGRSVAIRVSRGSVAAPPALVRLEPAAPGIFTYTFGEVRSFDVLNEAAAIATNANGTLNYPAQPAHPGDTITLRVTGLGDVTPNPEPLQRGSREPAAVVTLPEVLIDGRPAAVQAALLVPGEAGLYDLRVTIPTDTRTGVRVTVQLRVGEIRSNPAVISIE